MKLDGKRRSSNVEDRRGFSSTQKTLGGSVVVILIVLFGVFTGKDVSGLVDFAQNIQGNSPIDNSVETKKLTDKDKEVGLFVKDILGETEYVWQNQFAKYNMKYEEPKLVLFTNSVRSACGNATAAVGPFYCPADKKIYVDMIFFNELRDRFGAKSTGDKGDFSIAYAIAHEVGHHIQNLLGTSDKMRRLQARKNQKEANQLSVALELQADFYAGVFAHYQNIENNLEEGDIEKAISAATAIGDDAIQRRVQGEVVPDSFTHGSSQQRVYWFKKGYVTGDMSQANTFEEILGISL